MGKLPPISNLFLCVCFVRILCIVDLAFFLVTSAISARHVPASCLSTAPSYLVRAVILSVHTKKKRGKKYRLHFKSNRICFSIQNQQSLVLECSICAEQYGPEFNNQPRSLRCGHTFCTTCLLKIITPRGVPCPVCSRLHPLDNPDVMLLPVNHAVQEIMKNLASQDQQDSIVKEEQQRELPSCGVCGTRSATVVCIDCDPGNQFKFCEACDRDEHMRPFGPAQRHKRFPVDKVPPNALMYCKRHPRVTATLYSETTNEFACNMCQMEEDWQGRAPLFQLISECTKKMRGKVQKMTKYTNDVVKKLSESKLNLETIMNNLEPGSMTVKANITRTFSKCIEVLQERQRILLANVDVEVCYKLVLGCIISLLEFYTWGVCGLSGDGVGGMC